jgi:hypothetical protein
MKRGGKRRRRGNKNDCFVNRGKIGLSWSTGPDRPSRSKKGGGHHLVSKTEGVAKEGSSWQELPKGVLASHRAGTPFSFLITICEIYPYGRFRSNWKPISDSQLIPLYRSMPRYNILRASIHGLYFPSSGAGLDCTRLH